MLNFNIVLLVFFIGTALAVTEIVTLTQNKKHVGFRCEIDMNLAEPGEIITLSYHIQNASFWPMSFASFCFQFPEEFKLQESEQWMAVHRVGGQFANMYSFDVNLRPHRGVRGKLHFSVTRRGMYDLGRVYVETGDFFGFHSYVRTQGLYDRIICTAPALPLERDLQPLGGFLGDISVRRFIMEDPSLILGYRAYTGSEPMKSISWTQTARTGSLMVKKHDFTVDTDVSVLVDLEHCRKETAERCLSLVRTVCDLLEGQKMVYAVRSNGDLFNTEKGSGRMHNFEIQKRIGLCRFVRYQSFEEMAEQWARPGFSQRGCIVVAPQYTEELGHSLARLEAASGARVCLLTGEEV